MTTIVPIHAANPLVRKKHEMRDPHRQQDARADETELYRDSNDLVMGIVGSHRRSAGLTDYGLAELFGNGTCAMTDDRGRGNEPQRFFQKLQMHGRRVPGAIFIIVLKFANRFVQSIAEVW